MRISDVRIFTKLIVLVVLLSCVTIGISILAIDSLHDLEAGGDEIEHAGNEALTGARLNQEVIRINRGEFRIAAHPTPDEIREVEQLMAGQRRSLEEKLAVLKKEADPQQTKLLTEVDTAYRVYLADVQITIEKARQHGGQVVSSEAQEIIRKAALASGVTRGSFSCAHTAPDPRSASTRIVRNL